MPGYKMRIPDYYPAYAHFCVDDRGWIYVLTYESLQEIRDWDVFDADGRYFARIQLSSLPIVIKGHRIYAVQKDKGGFQFVKRYKITWNY